MTRKISVGELRGQLTDLLDQLDEGQGYFVVERDDREAAVLLSMEKFQTIMQILEWLNSLDIIETDPGSELPGDPERDFPDLTLLPSMAEAVDASEFTQPRRRSASSIEAMANKLGIRVIK